MLDTVVIVMSEGFSIMEPDLFEPSAKILTENSGYMGARGYIQCKQNPTKAELRSGIYKPRLTLTKRFIGAGRFGLSLKIELSLPKLIFGNNFDELQDSDFDSVVYKLSRILHEEMGVDIFTNILEEAPISSVHYSKNIPITDGRRPKYWLDRLAEANTTKILDTNKSDYRNEGHLFKLHAKSYEVAFYDKVKDLQQARKSDSRAYNQGNEIQLELFDSLKERKSFFEVLRVEIRLNTRQKIRSVFRQLNINSLPTLRGIFSSKQAINVIHYYIEEIAKKRSILLDFKGTKTKKFLTEVRIANPKMTPSTLLKLLGMKVVLEDIGMREIREVISSYSDRSWYRLNSEINKINMPNRKDPIIELKEKVSTYTPLHLVDYNEYLINNDKNETN